VLSSANRNTQTDIPPSYQENSKPHSSCQEENDFSCKNHKRNYYFEVYPHCVKFHVPERSGNPSRSEVRKRGKIHEFSKRSRFRLFTALAMIKRKLPIKPLFVSMTYHYSFTKKKGIHYDHLHNFLVQLRNYNPDVQYIWRIELQKRGAPHFHFIIFPGGPRKAYNKSKYIHKISQLWHSISDPVSRAHERFGVQTTEIKSYQHACYYLSKYCAKIDEDIALITERKQWGCSRNLPFEVLSSSVVVKGRAFHIIEQIRRWLIANGKEQYASEEFFNVNRSQIIFIDPDAFWSIYESTRSLPIDWRRFPLYDPFYT